MGAMALILPWKWLHVQIPLWCVKKAFVTQGMGVREFVKTVEITIFFFWSLFYFFFDPELWGNCCISCSIVAEYFFFDPYFNFFLIPNLFIFWSLLIFFLIPHPDKTVLIRPARHMVCLFVSCGQCEDMHAAFEFLFAPPNWSDFDNWISIQSILFSTRHAKYSLMLLYKLRRG